MGYVHEWADSFDRYGAGGVAADMTVEAYDSSVGFNNFTTGRTGRCLTLFLNGAAAYIERSFSAAAATWRFAFAWKGSNLSVLTGFRVFELWDGGTLHAWVEVRPASIRVFNGDGTQLATAAVTHADNTWYHIEGLITIDDATGVATISVDGVQKINATSLDTRNGGAAQATKFRLGSSAAEGSATTTSWDDLVIQPSAGAVIGPVQIDFLLPVGNTGENQLSTDSGGPGSTNFQHVDEAPANTTDYVESATAGQRDLYAMGSMTLVGSVLAVVATSRSLNTTGGGNKQAHVLKVGATEYAGSGKAITPAYTDVQTAFLPADVGGALSVAIVNAIAAGPQVA